MKSVLPTIGGKL